MHSSPIVTLKNFNYEKIGIILFFTGVFFLCSSIVIGGMFLLPSLLIGSSIKIREKNYFNDKWNCSLFVCGILILTNSLLQFFFIPNNYPVSWDPKLTLIGIFNWIPLFWIFWACQPYLNSHHKRKTFVITLIAGTLPLLITGFGQYFFKWHGPFKTINGLIIWYQRPITDGGLSGLFNNQNYAGTWLNFVWPLSIALILDKTKNIIKRGISLSFFISIGVAIFLTYSRNAWTGLFLVIPLVVGGQSFNFLVPILILFSFIVVLTIFPIFSLEFQSLIKDLIPERILLEFAKEGYENLDVTRYEIYKSALNMISFKPLIGSGAAAFTAIYYLQTSFFKGHSHNLITELAISYGIPVTVILLITIILLLVISGRIIFLKNLKIKTTFYERGLWASTFFFFLSQLVDIQYFDGKISIIAWILIAILKNIIDEDNYLRTTN